jgi:hypothetical protein
MKNIRKLEAVVHKRVRQTTIEEMVKTLSKAQKINLQGSESLRHTLYCCLYWCMIKNASFQSVDEEYGYPHSTLNVNFYRIMTSLEEWSNEKYQSGRHGDRTAAASQTIKYKEFAHSTLICDTNVFPEARVRGIRKGHKWWWGKTRSRGMKVFTICTHDHVVRFIAGPYEPYTSDSHIASLNRKKIQSKFENRDAIMGDVHFNACQRWEGSTWILKHKKPKRGKLSEEQEKWNKIHMRIGLGHQEYLWGKLNLLFEKLSTKIYMDPVPHFQLVKLGFAIMNVQSKK